MLTVIIKSLDDRVIKPTVFMGNWVGLFDVDMIAKDVPVQNSMNTHKELTHTVVEI